SRPEGRRPRRRPPAGHPTATFAACPGLSRPRRDRSHWCAQPPGPGAYCRAQAAWRRQRRGILSPKGVCIWYMARNHKSAGRGEEGRSARMAKIVLDRVTKVYSGGVTAVDDLSLDIHDEEFMGLVGPSGCGKSTALRC